MEEKTILLNNKNSSQLIQMNKLLFVTTSIHDHYLDFITKDETLISQGTLRELENKYSELIRCHRHILVNINAIKSIDKKYHRIYFWESQNIHCNISRRQYIKVYSAWERHVQMTF
ncbi:LytTR family transcriptional regulator DNA-binding domain-containing protein [Lentilactobacillus diolivorans]|uniref:HTH LytTR-type domain-containing protein n=1 Tax=Lentilactobacillus diolivorans TaxID=179838 RepID=A0ABQ0XGT1_9LACO|nr:LytTR family transcriptional regulator DNA-binding domain-containing protein [Lentilactobacillus diolivorans]MDH5105783.1 LytTR family transcriptional regulator DNA-binding domain-containing protein [Lentilactobacillus diolivorans]GEP25267.1 hypothetical protein LDI01_28600 [Lentilactobacillus diolivorans]